MSTYLHSIINFEKPKWDDGLNKKFQNLVIAHKKHDVQSIKGVFHQKKHVKDTRV